jgi:hypothetical protein
VRSSLYEHPAGLAAADNDWVLNLEGAALGLNAIQFLPDVISVIWVQEGSPFIDGIGQQLRRKTCTFKRPRAVRIPNVAAFRLQFPDQDLASFECQIEFFTPRGEDSASSLHRTRQSRQLITAGDGEVRSQAPFESLNAVFEPVQAPDDASAEPECCVGRRFRIRVAGRGSGEGVAECGEGIGVLWPGMVGVFERDCSWAGSAIPKERRRRGSLRRAYAGREFQISRVSRSGRVTQCVKSTRKREAMTSNRALSLYPTVVIAFAFQVRVVSLTVGRWQTSGRRRLCA